MALEDMDTSDQFTKVEPILVGKKMSEQSLDPAHKDTAELPGLISCVQLLSTVTRSSTK